VRPGHCHGPSTSMGSQPTTMGLNGPWGGAQRHLTPQLARPGCQWAPHPTALASNAGWFAPRGRRGAGAHEPSYERGLAAIAHSWPLIHHSSFPQRTRSQDPSLVLTTRGNGTRACRRDVHNESTRWACGVRTTVGILHSFLCEVHGDSRVRQPCLCDGHVWVVHYHRRKPCLQLEGANR
jgi:hypothetical protein